MSDDDDDPGPDFESLISTLEDQLFGQRVDQTADTCSWLADEMETRRVQDLDLIDLLRKTSKCLTRFKNNHL